MKYFGIFSFFLILCFLITPAFLSAQSMAEEIETLLNTGALTYAQTIRFALEASGTLTTSDHEEAFRYVMERKWLPKNISVNNEARLDVISLLLMRSFNIKGGIFYFLFKSPHHAYRELVYKDVIRGRADPAMKVSGELFILMIERIMAQRGGTFTIVESPPVVEEERPTVIEAPPEEEKSAIIEAPREEETAAVIETPHEEEAAVVREALATEINTLIDERNISDTFAHATREGIVIRIFNIQFEADSTELTAPEIKKIVEISNILRNYRGRRIQVSGHTAAAGSLQGQRTISLERARVIARYLVMLGACKAEDVTAAGFGAEQPIAGNDTAEGRVRNRRVEITILEN